MLLLLYILCTYCVHIYNTIHNIKYTFNTIVMLLLLLYNNTIY